MVGLKEENKHGVVSINGIMCPTVNREDWVRVPATPKIYHVSQKSKLGTDCCSENGNPRRV